MLRNFLSEEYKELKSLVIVTIAKDKPTSNTNRYTYIVGELYEYGIRIMWNRLNDIVKVKECQN